MSGRQQGLVTKHSHAKSRDGRVELGYEHFVQQHHDAPDEQPLRYRENLSPRHHKVEGNQRNRVREIPSDLHDGREYDWHMRRGRGDQVHSRPAPPVGRSEKRPQIDEMVLHMSPPPPVDARRGYDYVDHEDHNNETIRKSKHGYRYDDHVRINKQDYGERRFLVDNEHGSMDKNIVPVEDRMDKQPVRLHPNRRHGQSYGQSSQNYSALEMRESKEENNYYQEVVPPEKFYMGKYYKGEDKYGYRSRKFSHPVSPTGEFKDFGNQHFPMGSPSTSSGVIRGDYQGGLQDVEIHPFDGCSRKPEKLSENLGTREYDQKPHFEPRKDYEAEYADHNCDQCDPYGCMWDEHQDYAYANAETGGKYDPGYISRDFLYREGRIHPQMDSEHRSIQRPSIARPIEESATEAEGSHRIYSDNGLREFDIGQKEEAAGYVDVRRAYDTSVQEADCLDSGYAPAEFTRRASQDRQLNEASALHDHEMSAYNHQRYGNVARTQRERVKSSPELVDPVVMQRFAGRENRYADDQVAYNRMVKRKYLQDDEGSGFSLGTTVSHKWTSCSGNQQMGDRPQWINTSSSGLHSKVPSGYEPDLFLEAKDMMDEIYRCKDSVRYGWSDRKWENMQAQSIKSFESGRKYKKVHPKSEFFKDYGRSHYINYRNDRYQQHYVGKRREDGVFMDVVAKDYLTEDPKCPLKYDLHENSEGFKQSVLEAFLMYSKKLNENPPIRKLYKDQGNSGALFCIVCGRSVSKLFRDTEGLARHAFMSHKASLRAQHLALNKAICVLMGWNTEVPGDIITWVPQALPQAEAMAQKEDLIVWQPTVIIHNISLSNTNHREWKVISLEALEDIVRAKSIIRSKIKICLGYPGDQSVMLVKFLGTFTGLQEAEKLHKYFSEKGRGRADFQRAISDMTKSSGPVQGSAQEETEQESLLYGYLGIAEDLDRLDFDTKRRCKIQSKKGIQDIVDAPLKTE